MRLRVALLAFAAFWPYLGLPPSRVSFLYFATMLLSYVAEGSFYCRGGFQRVETVDRVGHEVLVALAGERGIRQHQRRGDVGPDKGRRPGATGSPAETEAAGRRSRRWWRWSRLASGPGQRRQPRPRRLRRAEKRRQA